MWVQYDIRHGTVVGKSDAGVLLSQIKQHLCHIPRKLDIFTFYFISCAWC